MSIVTSSTMRRIPALFAWWLFFFTESSFSLYKRDGVLSRTDIKLPEGGCGSGVARRACFSTPRILGRVPDGMNISPRAET